MRHDPYLDHNTGLLKNKLNLNDAIMLSNFERDYSFVRSLELAHCPIKGRFDLTHWQKIHAKMFGDVYDWAGQLRTVDISKGQTRFAHADFIVPEANKIFNSLRKENNLVGLSHVDFSSQCAYYIGELNVVHPFREGNGRSLRELINQLSKNAGYTINWQNISQQEMIQACAQAYYGTHDLLTTYILKNSKPTKCPGNTIPIELTVDISNNPIPRRTKNAKF